MKLVKVKVRKGQIHLVKGHVTADVGKSDSLLSSFASFRYGSGNSQLAVHSDNVERDLDDLIAVLKTAKKYLKGK